jgi:ubiquinone/menaquinone biosynthesis C-methylase UbiE
MSIGRIFEDWLRTGVGYLYRKSLRNLELRGDESVLEMGCGGGHSAKVVLAKLGGGGSYTGFDVDGWWTARAERRLSRFSNAKVLLGDVRDLPLEDDSFDTVVIHLVLHDVPEVDREPIVGVLARKLRSGGRLYIREPTNAPHGMPVAEIWGLMEGAGLEEVHRIDDRIFILGPVVEGHFVKR